MKKKVKIRDEKYLSTEYVMHNKCRLNVLLDKLLGKTTLSKLTVHNYLEYGWETNGLNQVFKKRRYSDIAIICKKRYSKYNNDIARADLDPKAHF